MRRELVLLIVPALVTACRAGPGPYQVVELSTDSLAIPPLAQRALVIEGFAGPESVAYDADQDVYFVSNSNGAGSTKDNNGYIIRIDASQPSLMETFVAGGREGVTLHAPKGMALQGDVLWVTDIDVVRGFDRSTGKPVATIDLSAQHAVMLNDIALGADGALYITDGGVVMNGAGAMQHTGGDRVIAVQSDGAVHTVAQGVELGHPHGIAWDTQHERWLIVSFDPAHGDIFTLAAAGKRQVLATGAGGCAGIEMLADGRYAVTCWNDHSIHIYGHGTHDIIARDLIQPGGLAFDTRRNRLVVPLVLPGRIEVWQLVHQAIP